MIKHLPGMSKIYVQSPGSEKKKKKKKDWSSRGAASVQINFLYRLLSLKSFNVTINYSCGEVHFGSKSK
jgi:hypothetical protein